jgi:hypothetical protein
MNFGHRPASAADRQERQTRKPNRPIWNEAGLFYALRITDSQWRALGRQQTTQQIGYVIVLNLPVRLTLPEPLLPQPDLHRNAAARCGLELRLPQPHQGGH